MRSIASPPVRTNSVPEQQADAKVTGIVRGGF